MCNHYKIPYNKVVIIPYTPSNLFKKNKDTKLIKNKFNYIKNYFFYPAQIWGHKNHISILKAAKDVKKRVTILALFFLAEIVDIKIN